MKKHWWAFVGDWTYKNTIRRYDESGSVTFIVRRMTRKRAKRFLRKLAKRESKKNGVWHRFRAEPVDQWSPVEKLRVILEKTGLRWRLRKRERFVVESVERLPKKRKS